MSIVTEYMKFGNLYDMLHNDAVVVTPKMAHTLAMSITKGMQYIHAAGMLHRDLKTPKYVVLLVVSRPPINRELSVSSRQSEVLR